MWIICSFVIALTLAVGFYYSRKYRVTSVQEAKLLRGDIEHNDRSRGPMLSFVVPCYNEEERLPPMLEETTKFAIDAVRRCTSAEIAVAEGLFSDFEIIVVNDCSTDNTKVVVEKFKARFPTIKVRMIDVKPNHGKGFAVRQGFFAAHGDYVLMVDGDNATKISDVTRLFQALRGSASTRKSPPMIALGSRAHLEKDSIAKRTFGRTLLMKAFHFVVTVTYFVCTGTSCEFRDTQCGFKLFDRRACELVFVNARLERWAFDVELLLLAQKFGLRGKEVPVNWEEIPGSKVRVMGMVQMGLECALMCLAYPLGFWTVKKSKGQ